MLRGINLKDVAAQLHTRAGWLAEYVGNVEQFLAKQDWRFINGVWLMTPTPVKATDGDTVFPNIIWNQNTGLRRWDGYIMVKNVELRENGIKFEFRGSRTIEYKVRTDGSISCEDNY